MPQLYVAFDTTVYRGLSAERCQHLQARERNHSVVGVCSRWVVEELLAHTSNQADPAYRPAIAALNRLAPHCRTYNGSHYILNLIADVDDQIAYAFLRRRSATNDKLSAYLAELVGVVVEHPRRARRKPYRDMLQGVAEDVAKAEENFVSNIWKNIYLSSMPKAAGWDAFIRSPSVRQQALREIGSQAAVRTTARVWLRNASRRVGLDLSQKQRTKVAARIRKELFSAIKLQNELIGRIVRDGIDLRKDKHRNILWDLHTAMTVVAFARIHHTPLWLITDDRAILKAAAVTGNSDIVQSLADYERRLEAPELF